MATILKRGDIAIIAVNTEDNGSPQRDSISFILLAPVTNGTVIYVTDRNWNGTSFSAGGGDGTFAYTAVGALAAGTVITISQAQLTAAGMNLSDSGETIYLFQGADANTPTTFLHAVDIADGPNIGATIADSFDGNELLNTGLVNGVSAVAIGTDNARFGTRLWNINKEDLFLQVNNATDWNNNNNSPQLTVNAGEPHQRAPDSVIYVAGSGAGEALIQLNLDGTYGSGTVAYAIQQAFQNDPALNHPSDITFDTVNDKFFFVDSDIFGVNRIVQGSISQILSNPGAPIVLTTLWQAATADIATGARSISVDLANQKIYFDAGTTFNRINYDAANQTKTQLADLGTYITQMSINYATGNVFLASSSITAVFGSDYIDVNKVYRATGLTGSNAANSVTFGAINFGANGDTSVTGEGSPLGNDSWPVERGNVRGIDIDEVSGLVYIVTGSARLDNDGDGFTTYFGGVWTYNPTTGAVTNLYRQNGTTGPVGLLYYIDVDPITGRYYVLDETGTNASPEDSSIWSGALGVAATPTLIGVIGNINGLGGQGLEIQHAPTLTGTGLAAAVTEATNAPGSGTTAAASLFSGLTANDLDTTSVNELRGAIVRISGNFQLGSMHQDVLSIGGATSGSIAGTSITYSYSGTTGTMTFAGVGTVAQYAAAIASVGFATSGDDVTAYGNAPNRTVSASVFDGLLYSDEISTTVTVTGINDAPVNTLGAQAAGTEDVLVTAVTGLAVSDVDADPAAATQKLQVTLSIDFGTLTIRTDVAGGIVAGDITFGANGSSSVTVTATQNAINTTFATVNATPALNGVTLATSANFNGAVTMTVSTNDLGANGNDPGLTSTGTTESDVDIRVITITAVNDAPTIADTSPVAAATILEDQPTAGELVSALFGGRFSDALDQQASGGNPTGSAANTLAGIAITANGSTGATGQWQYFNGTIWVPIGTASVGAAVLVSASTAIRFSPALNYNSPTAPTLTVALVDSSGAAIVNGSTIDVTARGGTTRYSSSTLTLTETVTAVNDAPVNTVPGAAFNFTEGLPVNGIPGLSIADVDAGTATVEVRLNVIGGSLTLRSDVANGLIASEIVGNGSGSIVVTSTIAKINATLASAGFPAGLTYSPFENFNGTDTLTITTNDLGASGLDPALTGTASSEQDVDTVTLNVAAVNDAPTVVNGTTQATLAIFEEQPSATGETVSTLFGSHFSDALDAQTGTPNGSAANTLAGIAVTANGSSAGTGQWQYFNGATWVSIGTASTASALLITAGTAIRFNPASNYNGAAPTLTAVLVESGGAAFSNGNTVNISAGGSTGGTTRYSAGTVTLSGTVAAVNDAPLYAAGGAQPSYNENAVPVAIATGVTLSDVDNANFNGGTLTVTITAGAVAGDALNLPTTGNVAINQGTGAVVVGGTQIGTVTTQSTGSVTIAFTNADASSVVQLTQAIGFVSTSDNPTNAPRTITFALVDGSGTANGGTDTASFTRTVSVTPVDDAPVAVADTATTLENASVAIDVVALDTDIDGGPKAVASINGTAVVANQVVTLASGATATLGADGRVMYNPNGKFDYLVSSATAAATGAQSSATDNFTYALNGGSSTTVTVTVNGVTSAGDQLRGSAGADTITGTTGADYVDISQGGTDMVNAGNGDDLIFVGPGFDSGDQVNGGVGYDQVGLRGSYTGSLGNVIDTEFLAILSGTSTRYGGDGSARYSYNLTTTDATVAAGQVYTIQANELVAGENLRFDGSAELDGSFRFYAGKGADTLIGGSGDDGFLFGEGLRFTAADQINGGAGNDQLALRGNYSTTISFTSTTLVNVETIVLLSATGVPAGAVEPGPYGYRLSLNDATVGAGQTLTVNAAQLGTTETAYVSGSNETDGKFMFIGGQGADTFIGGAGADTFYGGGGNDMLLGLAGDDVIRGVRGADTMIGGSGRDTFLFGNGDVISTDIDRINDFTTGTTPDGDALSLQGLLTGLSGSPTASELSSYLAFSIIGGTTRLSIDTNGAVGGQVFDGFIDFANTNLFTQYGINPASGTANADLIQQMLDQFNLIIG